MGKLDARARITLRQQPGFLGLRVPELSLQHLDGGASTRIVESNQRLPRGHLVAVLHQNAADDATLQMLDCLAARLRLDGTSRDGGALKGRLRRPDAEPYDENADHRESACGEKSKTLERRPGRRRQYGRQVIANRMLFGILMTLPSRLARSGQATSPSRTGRSRDALVSHAA